MGFRILRLLVVVGLVGGSVAVTSAGPASGAPGNPWPHTIVSGFATPTGDGFWLVYADGTVENQGDAEHFGDASGLPLAGPLVGGAVTSGGMGYWLVAFDGGIFSYGDAVFYGSMGGVPLNQPVFSMAPTTSGMGYWLVAFDGGIFSFGDAVFYGSTGALALNQPITGITTSPSGLGYQMVARDGGVFAFGDYPFLGSLPGIGLSVADVVGAAQTPSGEGYWVARANGEVYSFGDAEDFGDASPPPGDPVAAIFSNPTTQGYWLVLASGKPLPFGPLRIVDTITSVPAPGSPGSFVASGSDVADGLFCDRGTSMTTKSTRRDFPDRSGLDLEKDLTCSDGSGTLSIKISVTLDTATNTTIGLWSVISGTGSYANTLGSGGLGGDPLPPDGIVDTYGGSLRKT